MKETAFLKDQFGELTASGTGEVGGKEESPERFGNVSYLRGAGDAGSLLLANGADALVAFDDFFTVRTEPGTLTGPTVEVNNKRLSQRN